MSDSLTSGIDFQQPTPPPPSLPDEREADQSTDAGVDSETLNREALEEAGRWRPAARNTRCNTLERSSHEAAQTITAALAKSGEAANGVASAAGGGQSLIEHRRFLRGMITETEHALETCHELPKVKIDDAAEAVPRPYAAARAFLQSTGFQYDPAVLKSYVEALQQSAAFELAELWAIQSMLCQVYLLEIARLLGTPRAAREEANALAGPAMTGPDLSMKRLVVNMRKVAETEWKELVEQMSSTERALRDDPAGAYPQMDADSRSHYRSVIRDLARRSKFTEPDIAREAIALSRLATTEWNSEPRRAARRRHVGYYLVDDGRPVLEHQIGYKPPLFEQVMDAVRRRPDAFYLLGIELLTFAVMAFVLNGLGADIPLIWAILLLLIPATESAIGAMNQLVSFIVSPRPLPKLDFSTGIPADCTTMVVVPTLMTSELQVRQMVRDLELRYIGNQDPNLHFALLTDFPDSPQPMREKSNLVDLGTRLIEELNDRYRTRRGGGFYLFHRDLVYNPVESTWMGWERKRGKLLDFNNLLRGGFDSFPTKVGDLSILPGVRYVITLDTDTQLPRDSARRIVGTIAHPLNRAVIDPVTNTVVEGYGILQPRIGISVRSANRSRLASIYSGEAGFDVYTRAVSDVYQDLMNEGSFTGKGIYEVDTFQRVLSGRFPLNTILSHDLIEGAYVRAGLLSDVELIDDYPSHFSAYSRRKHRWVRGDWQIMRWLLPRVPDYSGRLVPNPISTISKWKILDNLRRSLVEPATFILLLAGWFFLPGGPALWTLAVLALLLIPAYLRLVLAFTKPPRPENLSDFLVGTAEGFVTDQLNVFMLLAFLAHQVLVTLDAIVRTIVRITITRRRLLEWETAAEAEEGSRRTPVDLYLELTPLVSIVIGLLLFAIRPKALTLAIPILVIWACSGLLSRWLNRPLQPGRNEISQDEELFLRAAALRTWRFFRSFSNERNHWLVPDTVQDDPLIVIQRLSPTNLGMLLNTRIAAHELGYLTLTEFLESTEHTLATMRSLPRHRGHFYNWYEIATREPLHPLFVSTVDSGNLACCLLTLKQSCLELADCPIDAVRSGQGVLDHLRIVVELARKSPHQGPALAALSELQSAIARPIDDAWLGTLAGVERSLNRLREAILGLELSEGEELRYWIQEARSRVAAVRALPGTREPGLSARLRDVAAECDSLVAEMDFSFLYRADRKVLSIGYDVGHHRLEQSCYDLLASEARTAVFVAIAKGELPQESWFRLGRSLGIWHGWRALLSWSGTMFEYLMPVLWMRTYPRTLLDQTLRSAVQCQRRAPGERKIPWGISESACGRKNELGHYIYHAFGLRPLALRPDLFSGMVISPYSSCLALAVNTTVAVENLRHMLELGWLGSYGFYEAADYSEAPSGATDSPTLVRSWMAHHQGMSLLAICNLLSASVMQNLFHAEPMVAATERLLQEKVPRVLSIETPEAQQA